MADLYLGLLMTLTFGLMINEFDLIDQLLRGVRYGSLSETDRTLIK